MACLALIGYLVLSVLVYLRTCVRGEFTISYGKLGPTEGRLIAMSANALIFFIGNPQVTLFQLSMSAYDWIVVGIILLLLVITVSTALRQARILAEQDPPGGNRS